MLGFIEDLAKSERYKLIFISSGSFGLIIDSALAALKTLYHHLSDDGILVFAAETIGTLPKQFGIWRSSTWSREDGTKIVANFLDLPVEDNIASTLIFKISGLDFTWLKI